MTTARISFFLLCNLLLMYSTMLVTNVASATSMRDDGLPQLLRMSDVVVLGRSTAVDTLWRKNKIYTRVTVKVDEQIKGVVASEIVIELLGGTAVHPRLKIPVTMSSSGNAQFFVGEEAVLLLKLKPKQTDIYQLVGMSKGKVAVRRQPGTGEKVIPIGPKKLRASPGINKQAESATELYAGIMSLNEYLAYIRRLIANEPQRAAE